MFAILVIIIVTVGLVSTLGYTMFSYQRTAEMSSMVLRNTARMDVIAMTLRSASRPLVAGGPVRLPKGDVVQVGGTSANGNRVVVPMRVVGSNLTPWGAEYGYCVYDATPVGGEVLADAPQTSADGEMLLSELGGEEYVIGHDAPTVADLPTDNIIGFVIAPTPGRQQLPSCAQIVFSEGAFLINALVGEQQLAGGTVVPIMAEATRLSFQDAQMEQILYVGDGQGQGGTGENDGDRMSYDDALDYWNGSTLSHLILDVDGPLPIAAIADRKQSGVLTLRGGSLTAPGGQAWVKVGSDLVLEGVQVAPNVGFHVLSGGELHVGARRVVVGSAVAASHSSIGRLRVDGGIAVVEAGTTIETSNAASTPVEMSSGELRLSSFLLDMPNGFEAPTSILVNGSAPTAIGATGGIVSVAVNLNAPSHALPWSIQGSAVLDVGAAGLVAAYADGTVPIQLRANVVGDMDGNGVATATCPAIQPHAVSGGCIAVDGMLSSSSAADGSWSCKWTAWSQNVLLETVSIPLPSSGQARAVCSISP